MVVPHSSKNYSTAKAKIDILEQQPRIRGLRTILSAIAYRRYAIVYNIILIKQLCGFADKKNNKVINNCSKTKRQLNFFGGL